MACNRSITVGRRAAEGERHDRDPLLERQRELLLPEVVVAARLAERDAAALALGRSAAA